MNEMLEELAGDVFVSGILFRELQSDCQHVQAIHTHPAGAVRLLEVASGGKWRGTVKDSDIVEAEKSALKNVCAVGILAVYPPGKIQEQLVKNLFEESAVGDAAHAPLDFVDAPGCPRMNRRIHVAKSPLVGGQLPVGMHVPFAQKKNELFLGKIGIDQREPNALKRQVPCRIPRILPFVGHGNNDVVVEIGPILVAAVPSAS